MIRLFVIAKQQILLCCARVCFVQRRALPVVARVSECTPEQSPMTPSPPVHLMTSLASVRLSAGIQCFCHTFHSPKLRYLFNRLIFLWQGKPSCRQNLPATRLSLNQCQRLSKTDALSSPQHLEKCEKHLRQSLRTDWNSGKNLYKLLDKFMWKLNGCSVSS